MEIWILTITFILASLVLLMRAAKWLGRPLKRVDARVVVPNLVDVKGWAERGSAEGQFCLGLMYAEGWGVSQDHTEAVKWYRKAMDQGDDSAMNSLALILATSKDERVRDLEEAIAVALKAVELNPHPGHLDTLAQVYHQAGQNGMALDAESRALALSPDNASYKRALEKYRSSPTTI
jgi:TPR repeat protein